MSILNGYCPKCDSYNTECTDGPIFDGNQTNAELYCTDCETKWYEVYTLIEQTIIVD